MGLRTPGVCPMLKQNISSMRCFEKAGFYKKDTYIKDEGIVWYNIKDKIKESVVPAINDGLQVLLSLSDTNTKVRETDGVEFRSLFMYLRSTASFDVHSCSKPKTK